MRYTTLPDTLLVNGVDLQEFTGVIVADLDGVHSPGTRRGDNDVIPGRPGQLGATKPLDAYNFAIPITVLPVDEAGAMSSDAATRRARGLTNLRALARWMSGDGGLVVLTRRLLDADGVAVIDATCAAEFVDGLAPDLLTPDTGKTELQFMNLDGCWHGVTQLVVGEGTVTVAGDVVTNRIMLELPGAGTLRNMTLGVAVTVTTAATLDVANFEATAGLATLTHAGDRYWFGLVPGENVLTWSGSGSPSVGYRAAYL